MIAKDLAAGLPEAKVYSIPHVIHGEIDFDADNIGIVFPVYFAGIPRIISEFVRKLDPAQIKYLFAVAAYGGYPGVALPVLQHQLQSEGILMNAGYCVQMPGNYIVKYGAYSQEKQYKIFRKKEEALGKIIKNTEAQKNIEIKQGGFLAKRIGNYVYQSKLRQFPTLDMNFTANEKCNGCGTCEKICPVRNIDLNERKPRWHGNCEHCMACIQWCPMEAIQYSAKTIGRKRYRHPDSKAEDLY